MNQRSFPALTSLRPTAHVASVLSHEFVKKVFVMQAALLQPRQGRKIVAQGVSPGCATLTPSRRAGHPSPAQAGEGTGVREVSLTHGLRRGLNSYARSAG
jgi:hypothetical protein